MWSPLASPPVGAVRGGEVGWRPSDPIPDCPSPDGGRGLSLPTRGMGQRLRPGTSSRSASCSPRHRRGVQGRAGPRAFRFAGPAQYVFVSESPADRVWSGGPHPLSPTSLGRPGLGRSLSPPCLSFPLPGRAPTSGSLIYGSCRFCPKSRRSAVLASEVAAVPCAASLCAATLEHKGHSQGNRHGARITSMTIYN